MLINPPSFGPAPAPPPPIGVPVPGGFLNPSAQLVTTNRLLPAIPTATLQTYPVATALSRIYANANAGSLALTTNAQNRIVATSVATMNNYPAVGSAGSTGLDGAAATTTPVAGGTVAAPIGSPGAVGPVQLFQGQHPALDVIGRIGLPIAAFFAWRGGHHVAAGVLLAPAAVLWFARGRL